MRRILINMKNFLLADAICMTLKKAVTDIEAYEVFLEETPDSIEDTCKWLMPYAAIMDVSLLHGWTLNERLEICGRLRQNVPECKLLLSLDERQDANLTTQVKRAKIAGQIDGFIFESISSDYLKAIIDTL